MRNLHRFMLAVVVSLAAVNAHADVVEFKILKREPFANGQVFGDVGPYDQITAIARFAIDPKHAANAVIVDLDRAPRDADGKVLFASDVVILTPKDPAKGNGAIFYDVNNRGKQLALGFFNRPVGGPSPDATNPAGDGFLMRKGYTVVWSGWLGELLPGEGRLLMQTPQAYENDKLVRGIVRYEMSSDKPVKSMPLSRRPNHGSYLPTKEGETMGALTKRTLVDGPREVITRDKWKLKRQPLSPQVQGVAQILPEVQLEIAGGFQPGVLYELICEAEGSLVQGVAFAGVRDLISFLRHETAKHNPLLKADGKPAITAHIPSASRKAGASCAPCSTSASTKTRKAESCSTA